MSRLDMAPESVTGRLLYVARITDLNQKNRIIYKINLSPEAVQARLRRASDLQQLCLKLGRSRES